MDELKQRLDKFLLSGDYVDLCPERAGDPKWDKAAYKRLHTPIVKTIDIGRNDPCTCGSGKKYKHCCLIKGQAVAAA